MLPTMTLPSMSWMLLSCLMLLTQVQGEDSKDEVNFTRGSCPPGSYAFRSLCYALFRTPKSWNEADIACQKRPTGSLASVLSGAEASFLASVVKNNLNTYQYIWIGFHDPTQGYEPNGGGWEWSNNDVLNYVAWEKTPPSTPNPGYCASLSQHSGYQKWKDYSCDQKLPYICKFKN
ncbi:lithostathine-like [Molossus nigricans]|uniref:lithostathine-like isoform X1 n=1 Tax=Molossus molossus TaxID=27622 RepID=UPI00174671C8|nr:lithostathine-like isoform X1 [Molossus molossus]